MRNHVIFKFLAIALCALCLMGAIVSGGSLIMLASLELEDGQSPREKQWESLEQNLQWDARSYVARYVTREKGAVDETFLALEEQDRAFGTEYLHTVRTYLEHGQNAGETARALNVHRNTVDYRMEKVRDRFGLDLTRDDVLFRWLLSFRIRDYCAGNGQN